MTEATNKHFETLAIHAGDWNEPDPRTVPVPIYASANYRLSDPESHGEDGYYYSRMGNPTVGALERAVAAMEGGTTALGFASGMAAVMGVMSLLESGDHLVSSLDIYGGVARLQREYLVKRGITYDLVDIHDRAAVVAAIKPNTKMIWVDSMSNPYQQVTDIAMMAEIAREHGLLLGVDNTLATPYYLNPIALGADIVVHSCTKYLGGHDDLFAGVAVVREDLYKHIHAARSMTGGIMGPFDAFLVLRGLKTLAVRLDRMSQNAMEVATFLEAHARVAKVVYPGLESHNDHAIAKRQMRGYGSMVTFGVEGGHADALRIIGKFRVITSAVSFGGVESLSEFPPQPTPIQCKMAGLPDGLAWVRVSIGLEHKDDLIADLDQALAE